MTDSQHSFWLKCYERQITCNHNILHSFHIPKIRQVDTIILAFAKAFDNNIPHQSLLAKLEYYGIWGQVSSWITTSSSAAKLS